MRENITLLSSVTTSYSHHKIVGKQGVPNRRLKPGQTSPEVRHRVPVAQKDLLMSSKKIFCEGEKIIGICVAVVYSAFLPFENSGIIFYVYH